MTFITHRDTGDETPEPENMYTKRCMHCGTTEDLIITTSSSEPSRVGNVECGTCMWEAGAAAGRRLFAEGKPWKQPDEIDDTTEKIARNIYPDIRLS